MEASEQLKLIQILCEKCSSHLLSVSYKTVGELVVVCRTCRKNHDLYVKEIVITPRGLRTVQQASSPLQAKKPVAANELNALDSAA